MKMKKINKAIPVIILTIIVFISGCKKFEDINTNPAGVAQDVFKADYQQVVQPLKNAQRALVHYINWEYQLQQNLCADIYSGYMMTPTPFNGNSNNSNYYMMDGWNEWVLNIAYDAVTEAVRDYQRFSLDYPDVDLSDADAMAKVIKVIEMHKASDVFGPIIYSKYGSPNADLSIDYDTQQEAYNAFFADLDSAAMLLTPYVSGQKAVGSAFKSADLIYQGNPSSWLKLVNTLRLRLALRIVYADETTAKLQGEKALNPANGGLITEVADNALVNYGSAHPIFDIINAWDDIRAGAPLGSYLNGYNDPRVSKYMAPATDDAVSGQFIGIRNGVNIDAKSRYSGYSKPAAVAAAGNYFDGKNGLAKIASAAESHFLMAEAALRGWTNAGDARANYEMGIQKSFDEWGAGSAADYIADNTSTPSPYNDPKAATPGQNDVPAGNANLSTITIQWDGGAGMERNLERIITQKWIALYPDAQEAWTEFRRTGYPKLFPVVVNNSAANASGAITGFIKRLPIPTKYQNNNKPGYTRAIASLGGPDNGSTRLWWDKK
jgi:hypothetical protein